MMNELTQKIEKLQGFLEMGISLGFFTDEETDEIDETLRDTFTSLADLSEKLLALAN